MGSELLKPLQLTVALPRAVAHRHTENINEAVGENLAAATDAHNGTAKGCCPVTPGKQMKEAEGENALTWNLKYCIHCSSHVAPPQAVAERRPQNKNTAVVEGVLTWNLD